MSPGQVYGCRLWRGALDADGYGVLSIDGTSFKAHRVSYTLRRGPIPEGAVLDHLCRVRPCVEPSHLEAVSQAENTRRGESPAGENARADVCPRGHPLRVIDSRGRRGCPPCKAEQARASRDRAVGLWR